VAKHTRTGVLQWIHQLVEDPRARNMTDQELLDRIHRAQDEAAFQSLVRRHGSMVLEVCRSVLSNEADADDAFQATFFVLAQKVAAIRKQTSVGSWLYGVAWRTALNARKASVTRARHERRRPSREATDTAGDLAWLEVQQVLYDEVSQISACYRSPLVLCYLEGNSQDEAARLLGVSKDTVKKRLERGRALLRVRLARRGLGPAAVLLAAAWPLATSAGPAPQLLSATVKLVGVVAVGPGAAQGLVSPKVAALAEAVLKMIARTKLKVATVAVLTLALTGFGTGMLVYHTLGCAQPVRASGVERSVKPEKPPVHATENAPEAFAVTSSGTEDKKLTSLNLQPASNHKRSDNLGSGRAGNDLSSLPGGRQTFAGVRFTIEDGFIQLGSRRQKERKPDKVEGIRVGRAFVKLHLLHATLYGAESIASKKGEEDVSQFVPDGTPIAEYRIRYEDGTTETILVVYGKDVRDWFFRDNSEGVTRGKVAWQGDNDLAKRLGCRIRLYLTTWENPHPNKRVRSIDYVKVGDTPAAPFWIAAELEHE
jgi:RNA polymerase sigma factor (sigma-70 family)